MTRLRLLVTLLIILFIVLPSPAHAQSARAAHVATGAYVTAGFYDATASTYAIAIGRFREVNPVLRPIVEHKHVVVAMTVKGAMHTAIAAFLVHDAKQHPRRAFWTALALGSAQAYVDVLITQRGALQR